MMRLLARDHEGAACWFAAGTDHMRMVVVTRSLSDYSILTP